MTRIFSFDSRRCIFLPLSCSLQKKDIYIEMKIKIKTASAGNRTRAARVAGEHSTTEPPMLICTICLTCTYKDKTTRVTWCMIDERQFQIGGSCTYHTPQLLIWSIFLLQKMQITSPFRKCRLSVSRIAYICHSRQLVLVMLTVDVLSSVQDACNYWLKNVERWWCADKITSSAVVTFRMYRVWMQVSIGIYLN